jgi:hypothetical protein
VYYLTIFVFFLVLIWTLSTCFTLDISLNKDIFDRSQNEKIEIYIKLGGATSDIDKVNVMLFDSLNNPINDKIIMHYRDSGEYFTYIDSSKLSSGYYKVTLTYSESPVLKRPFSATPEGFFVV